VYDPVTIAARRTLLDVLDLLGPHRRSVVLVGAQAIYVHIGESDLPVALYTKDVDLAIDPDGLGEEPNIAFQLENSGFVNNKNWPGKQSDEDAATSLSHGIEYLRRLFENESAVGCGLAAEALAGIEGEVSVRRSCAFLTQELLEAL
jgi:hypothetical protein